MALPNPNMNFERGEILTAAKMNQLAENDQYLANQFPIGTENIASGAVTLDKLSNSARPQLQLLVNTTVPYRLPANSYYYITLNPSPYSHLIVLASGQTDSYNEASWVDLRAFEDNSTELIKWNWSRIKQSNSSVVGESGTQSSALVALEAGGYTSFQMRAEVCHYSYSAWPLFLTQGGTPAMSVYGSAQRYNNENLPSRFVVASGAPIQAGLNIQVWASA